MQTLFYKHSMHEAAFETRQRERELTEKAKKWRRGKRRIFLAFLPPVSRSDCSFHAYFCASTHTHTHTLGEERRQSHALFFFLQDCIAGEEGERNERDGTKKEGGGGKGKRKTVFGAFPPRFSLLSPSLPPSVQIFISPLANCRPLSSTSYSNFPPKKTRESIFKFRLPL